MDVHAEPVRVIVDTDVGSDDLMAIAFLLARPEVRIEAITVVNGLAHVRPGANNLLKLLELANHPEIPVYLGSETPLQATAPFPALWRKLSNELPGVHLPATRRQPEKEAAVDYLARRLAESKNPVQVLALGPLSNLAKAFRRNPAAARGLSRMVVMGGAFHVRGNLADGGLFKTMNRKAEWNIFSDPLAARIVFESGAQVEVMPLDATGKVPIDSAFWKQVREAVHTPLGRFVAEVLTTDKEAIEGGYYQAWDPLAAVALVDPRVVKLDAMDVTVKDDGTTVASHGRGNTKVALDANSGEFRKTFLAAFR